MRLIGGPSIADQAESWEERRGGRNAGTEWRRARTSDPQHDRKPCPRIRGGAASDLLRREIPSPGIGSVSSLPDPLTLGVTGGCAQTSSLGFAHDGGHLGTGGGRRRHAS